MHIYITIQMAQIRTIVIIIIISVKAFFYGSTLTKIIVILMVKDTVTTVQNCSLVNRKFPY